MPPWGAPDLIYFLQPSQRVEFWRGGQGISPIKAAESALTTIDDHCPCRPGDVQPMGSRIDGQKVPATLTSQGPRRTTEIVGRLDRIPDLLGHGSRCPCERGEEPASLGTEPDSDHARTPADLDDPLVWRRLSDRPEDPSHQWFPDAMPQPYTGSADEIGARNTGWKRSHSPKQCVSRGHRGHLAGDGPPSRDVG
jgi:hypothetical protein